MNVLCLGGRIISETLAKDIVKEFINAKFDSQGRFERRKKKIEKIEKQNFN